MNTTFNWAGLLCLGAVFFAFLVILAESKVSGGSAGTYALISASFALLAVPFSTIKAIQ